MADKKIPPVVAEGDPRPLPAERVDQPAVSSSDSWAIMAMLQQIAVEQTATSVRLTNLAQRQAQLAGGAGAFGIADESHGRGAAPVQQALARERAKQSVNFWLSREGPRAYIIRGSYHVPEQLSAELLKQVLRKIAHVNEQMAQQLRGMANFDLHDFYPPMPAGCVPRPMAVEDHVSTFVAAVIAVVEHGMENAPPICTTRVDLLRVELQAAASQVSNYRYHRPELAGDDGVLRECALNAGNDDLREAFSELTVMASDMRRRYPDNAPPSGAGPIFNRPKFRRLMTLVDEAHEMNLVAIGAMRKEQAEVAQAAQAQASETPKAGQGGTQQVATRPRSPTPPRAEEGEIVGKRKGPPELSGVTDTNMAPWQRPRMFGNGRMGSPSAPRPVRNGFARELAFWDVPRGVCAHAWKGDTCRRTNCEFYHTRVHPDVAGAAAW